MEKLTQSSIVFIVYLGIIVLTVPPLNALNETTTNSLETDFPEIMLKHGFIKTNRKRLERMPKDWLVGYYSKIVQFGSENLSPLEIAFLDGLAARSRAEGTLPQFLFDAIMSFLEGDHDAQARGLDCSDNSCAVPISLQGLWGYGCWCNFDQKFNPFYGSQLTVNPFDSVCKRMHQCLRCVAEDSHYGCDVKGTNEHQLASALSSNDDTSMMATCELANQNSTCSAQACTCEVNLIAELIDLIWQETPYQPEYLHRNGFDKKNCMAENQSLDLTQYQCCGEYPTRYPFTRPQSCCREGTEEKAYNLIFESCCPVAGVVKGFSC